MTLRYFFLCLFLIVVALFSYKAFAFVGVGSSPVWVTGNTAYLLSTAPANAIQAEDLTFLQAENGNFIESE